MKMSKKLVFFGTEDFSAPVLRALIENNWQIEAIVTKPDARAGRGMKTKQPLLKKIGEQYDLAVLQPVQISELEPWLEQKKPDIGVLVAYGKIIPKAIIGLFPHGILNIHPSLLPKYRGPSPIETAILNGDTRTGVSLMQLSEKMDAGPVYLQKEIELNCTETKNDLYETLANIGARMLTSNLDDILRGSLKPTAQDDTEASYTKLLTKADGHVSWSEPAGLIERKVRAFEGFPKCRTNIFGRYEIVLLQVKVVDKEIPGKLVMAANPGYVEIQQLIAPSGRIMNGEAFLRGYKA